jgi:hypothetical protein
MWLICEDWAVRPVLHGEILAEDGTWHSVDFLLDTGADRTVISADVLGLLGLSESAAAEQLAGVGG